MHFGLHHAGDLTGKIDRTRNDTCLGNIGCLSTRTSTGFGQLFTDDSPACVDLISAMPEPRNLSDLLRRFLLIRSLLAAQTFAKLKVRLLPSSFILHSLPLRLLDKVIYILFRI
jgi:hypothetical protein